MPSKVRALAALPLVLTLAACAGGAPAPTTSGGEPQPSASAPKKPKITADQLLGQTDAWVIEHLGEPAFRRTDHFANLWQYKNASCVLNVFLYADGKDAAAPSRVLHFDARDARGGNAERDPCLSALQD